MLYFLSRLIRKREEMEPTTQGFLGRIKEILRGQRRDKMERKHQNFLRRTMKFLIELDDNMKTSTRYRGRKCRNCPLAA
jgi:hypothetical protein